MNYQDISNWKTKYLKDEMNYYNLKARRSRDDMLKDMESGNEGFKNDLDQF